MTTKERVLLIVEDERGLSRDYKLICELALEELSREGLSDHSYTVKQAFSLSEAKNILRENDVIFISIDIALGKEEKDLTDKERKAKDPGGIALLKELQGYKDEERPISVVLTAETSQSYATDAWRKYRVLAFYPKTDFNDEEYENAIKAALWYLDAAELVAKLETRFHIEVAEERWHKALEAAKIAGITEGDFPKALGYEIKLARDKQTHSATGLPKGRWTEEKLRSKVLGRKDWAFIRVTIKRLNEFIAAYPAQEEAILVIIASSLEGVRDEFADQDLFIGYLGHRESIPEPSFVVIPSEKSIGRVKDIACWIEKDMPRWIEEKSALFSSAFGDKARQKVSTLTVETTTWTSTDGAVPMFTDLHELLDTLGST